jgi:hypothetical protein
MNPRAGEMPALQSRWPERLLVDEIHEGFIARKSCNGAAFLTPFGMTGCMQSDKKMSTIASTA